MDNQRFLQNKQTKKKDRGFINVQKRRVWLARVYTFLANKTKAFIFVTNVQKRILNSSNVYNFKHKTIQNKNVFWPMKQHFPKFVCCITSDIENLTPKYQLFHIYRQLLQNTHKTRKVFVNNVQKQTFWLANVFKCEQITFIFITNVQKRIFYASNVDNFEPKTIQKICFWTN